MPRPCIKFFPFPPLPLVRGAEGGWRGVGQRVNQCIGDNYSDPKSFVNFLLPPRTRGEGWGGVKNLRLLQGLL